MMEAYRYSVVDMSGSPREMGRQHGEQRREVIAREAVEGVERFTQARGVSRRRALELVGLFERQYRDFAPHLIEEMEGVADATGLSFLEVLYLNTRYDLGALPSECTSFGVGGDATAGGTAIAGQNKDTAPISSDRMYLLRTNPASGARIMLLTYPGEVGHIGMGIRGISVFGNSLYIKGQPFGGTQNLVRRLMVEQETLEQCEAILQRLGTSAPGNWMVGEKGGRVADFEVAGSRYRRLDGGRGIITHANHVLHPDLLADEVYEKRETESVPRYERLRERLEAKAGSVSAADCREALKDHEHAPHSICRHAGSVHGSDIVTTSSLVADMGAGVLWIARGSPCQHEHVPFSW
ncbi:MAG: C45 family autoproteolytic acyltransferase/hydrolase [Anaerolineae bacterium]